MTDEQFVKAESQLIARLQSMRELESGARALIPKGTGSDDSGDTLDDEYDAPISSEYQASYTEWMQYCRLCKGSKKFPKRFKKEGLLEIGKIQFGIVEERGEDLETTSNSFKKCNLADFIDHKGYFNLVKFIGFNRVAFPFIYKLACCLAAVRMNEVGCERFFSIAGYVSNPRRTRLKIRHYEAMAMLKRNMQQIYIDEDWVVEQYMMLEKSKEWDSIETENDQMVAALEAEIYAEELGISVDELPMDENEILGAVAPVASAAVDTVDMLDSDTSDSTDDTISEKMGY